MTSQPLLEGKDLCLSFRQRKVLDNISLTVNAGQIITLIGPNGCGKSTLTRVLLGLQQPDTGSVRTQRNLRIGYMPQHLPLDERMPLTVSGFLRLTRRSTRADIAHWLERLNISHLGEQSVHKLSGGEWQRVLLARALLVKPQLLVLDEPVQGVDVQGQLELYQLIPALRDELGCAVLMVSHDLHLVMSATDEVICLNGHVCCSGHPETVSADPAYLELFGKRLDDGIAYYTHHHDHEHCDHDHGHEHTHDHSNNHPHDHTQSKQHD
ncbi:MAG: zinc ABC transporter ATP-binding protein ZnuC [Pseudomonadota bacterium]|nr:zinc ABC transporter ATP-binding protein ZnuC [Pseudomonadota bacterium]MEE2749135.1 zinc ABC transporter ATP-binding protein ZnuC [Pseudomonadota bacterium]